MVILKDAEKECANLLILTFKKNFIKLVNTF